MKLVVFNSGKLGALQSDGSVVELNSAYASMLKSKGASDPASEADLKIPNNLLEFIKKGEEGLIAAREAIEHVKNGVDVSGKLLYEPDEVCLEAPLPSLASRVAMAGANFYDHAADAFSKIRGENITQDDIRRQVKEAKRAKGST